MSDNKILNKQVLGGNVSYEVYHEVKEELVDAKQRVRALEIEIKQLRLDRRHTEEIKDKLIESLQGRLMDCIAGIEADRTISDEERSDGEGGGGGNGGGGVRGSGGLPAMGVFSTKLGEGAKQARPLK